jgi:hypothetical protein
VLGNVYIYVADDQDMQKTREQGYLSRGMIMSNTTSSVDGGGNEREHSQDSPLGLADMHNLFDLWISDPRPGCVDRGVVWLVDPNACHDKKRSFCVSTAQGS